MTGKVELSDMDLLTVTEVAAICRVTHRTVLNWIGLKLLPGVRLPGRGDFRVRRTDLEKILKPGASRPSKTIVSTDDRIELRQQGGSACVNR